MSKLAEVEARLQALWRWSRVELSLQPGQRVRVRLSVPDQETIKPYMSRVITEILEEHGFSGIRPDSVDWGTLADS